jgi:hypothetical protein
VNNITAKPAANRCRSRASAALEHNHGGIQLVTLIYLLGLVDLLYACETKVQAPPEQGVIGELEYWNVGVMGSRAANVKDNHGGLLQIPILFCALCG